MDRKTARPPVASHRAVAKNDALQLPPRPARLLCAHHDDDDGLLVYFGLTDCGGTMMERERL